MNQFIQAFSDPQKVAVYVEGPPRFVPGLADLHKMAAILLQEKIPDAARILVLGAGGGMEMTALARSNPAWRFDGIDPSAAMLAQAHRTMGDLAERAVLHQGLIDDAPLGPYDAGICLLTLHFLEADERRRTLMEIHRRLRPGAPFVVAHCSFPQQQPDRDLWLSRYAAFAVVSGVDREVAEGARTTVAAMLSVLSPEQDEALMAEAGFRKITPFYAAFSWRGWVATA